MYEPVTITLGDANLDPEVAAICRMGSILGAFDSKTRQRILDYLQSRYQDDLREVARIACARPS